MSNENKKTRLHAVGVFNIPTAKHYSCRAFPQQLRLFCNYMAEAGFDIVHYGHEHSTVTCQHVTVVSHNELCEAYGDDYEQKQGFFDYQFNDLHKEVSRRCAEEIKSRKSEFDIVLFFWGVGHRQTAEFLPGFILVEPIVCYPQCFAPFRVFCSYSYQTHLYVKQDISASMWDAVIPLSVDPKEFEYKDKKDDYFLYMGRLIESKGVAMAVEATRIAGKKLVVVGPGDLSFCNPGPHVEYLGVVGPDVRKELLSRAKALLVPTQYLEPQGLVVAEAMVSGTPVITTDWGGFAESNRHGKTGYRIRTLDQFLWAIHNIDKISHYDCYEWSKNFWTDVACLRYQEYFHLLQNKHGCDLINSVFEAQW